MLLGVSRSSDCWVWWMHRTHWTEWMWSRGLSRTPGPAASVSSHMAADWTWVDIDRLVAVVTPVEPNRTRQNSSVPPAQSDKTVDRSWPTLMPVGDVWCRV